MKTIKALIAAGGTGGHLFPALAVAEEFVKQTNNGFEAFFIGNPNRLESGIVPASGYSFTPIPITGFSGVFSPKTLSLPYRILKSVLITRGIVRKQKPDFVLCTGAYLSYPAGLTANQMRIPLVLMESNVFPGKTIRMLAAKADLIITSFEETKKYFPFDLHSKIVCFGNPLRKMFENLPDKETAIAQFGLKTNKKTILIFGGSLGARAINNATFTAIEQLSNEDIQFIWQTGNDYQIKSALPDNIKLLKFIDDMASAYSAADLVVCRSGATTVAELTYLSKPSILVPLPSASNNEQKSNAEVLSSNSAAILLDNSEVGEKLGSTIIELINDSDKLSSMSYAAGNLARKDAAEKTVQRIRELIKK
jgi:UDP-N-acetylglucosamine--N-acetylmuramyl-(pentapeptide) pyrophosphoryl-undecaprenol N-acetylglucosamine transferase